jgi:hypothetical protein
LISCLKLQFIFIEVQDIKDHAEGNQGKPAGMLAGIKSISGLTV